MRNEVSWREDFGEKLFGNDRLTREAVLCECCGKTFKGANAKNLDLIIDEIRSDMLLFEKILKMPNKLQKETILELCGGYEDKDIRSFFILSNNEQDEYLEGNPVLQAKVFARIKHAVDFRNSLPEIQEKIRKHFESNKHAVLFGFDGWTAKR